MEAFISILDYNDFNDEEDNNVTYKIMSHLLNTMNQDLSHGYK